MKNLFSIIVCLLALCIALCACGRDDSVGEMASEAISNVETHASEMFSDDNNGEVNDGDGYIGNESTSENGDNNSSQNNSGSTQNNGNSSQNNSGSTQNNGNSSQNSNNSSQNAENSGSTNSDMM